MSAVAPFAGTWIEIGHHVLIALVPRSLPSRERGLKSAHTLACDWPGWSLPSRERGLK